MHNQKIYKINFASDVALAYNIYNYFVSNSKLKENIKLEEDNIIISTGREDDGKVNKQIISILQEYLNSSKIYNNYQILEFDNIFTVGIPKDIVEISKFVFCEICGYGLSNEEELLVHRRSHGII
ncbi:MAG: hypothetical protein AB7P56_07230 [Nitrososphaeraceae archaeon]